MTWSTVPTLQRAMLFLRDNQFRSRRGGGIILPRMHQQVDSPMRSWMLGTTILAALLATPAGAQQRANSADTTSKEGLEVTRSEDKAGQAIDQAAESTKSAIDAAKEAGSRPLKRQGRQSKTRYKRLGRASAHQSTKQNKLRVKRWRKRSRQPKRCWTRRRRRPTMPLVPRKMQPVQRPTHQVMKRKKARQHN